MKRLLLLLTLAIITITVSAQIEVKGKVVDSKTGEGLLGAVIKATSSDGGSGTFAVADSTGAFTLKFEGHYGKYEIEYSCIGYKSKTVEDQWIHRGAKLNTVKLKEDATVLKEVTVTGLANRASVKGDTLVYSADAFKVIDGSSAADLVKKMPGITVDKEGVKAQGETVQKLTVDGKEFFEYDPQLALNVLPAEVVKDVQVYDRKSDKAEQTGFDDGSRTKAMNLNTKAYKRTGIFGKIYGSGGLSLVSGDNPIQGSWGKTGLYKGGFNLNIFNSSRRISILGLTNNVDQTFFDFGDLNDSKSTDAYNVGVHEMGIARANAFGINYNEDMLGGKLKISSSYFTNIARHESADSTEYDRTDMEYANIGSSNGVTHNNKHIFNSRITYDIDKNNTLLFIPKITYHKRDEESFSNSKTWLHNMESMEENPELWNDVNTTTRNHSNKDSEEFSAQASLRYTHRFEKQGRSLSTEVSGSVTNKTSHSDTENNVNNLITNTGYKGHSNVSNIAANVSYTEPLAEKHLLEIGVHTNYYKNKDSNDYYTASTPGEKATTLDGFNSYSGDSHNFSYSVGANYNWRFGDFTLIPSISFNHKNDYSERSFENWQTAYGDNPTESITRSFSWVKPSVQLNWRKNTSFLRASYSMDTETPYLGDLYTKLFTSNPYSFFVGNPDLKESQRHSFNVNFSTSSPEKGTNFYTYFSYSHTTNGQGSSTITNLSKQPVLLSELPGYDNDSRFAGVSLPTSGSVNTKINTGSSNNLNAFMMFSGPLKFISCNYQIGFNTYYSTNPQQVTYFMGKDANGTANYRNLTGTYERISLSPNFGLTSSISDKIDFSVDYSLNWNKSWSNTDNSRNATQINHDIQAELKWEVWNGFIMQLTDQMSNYKDQRENKRITQQMLNVGLAKKFGKKNCCEIKLEMHDMLNQNKGYYSGVGDGGSYSSWNKQMPRYTLLTFTYQLKG